jgi:hypothetical protein
LEIEEQRGKGAAKGDDKNEDFATVGEKLWRIKSALDVVQFARTVELSRTTVGHASNDRSSRSHCLVHVHVSQTDEKGLMTKKQLSVVDLAGSERIAKG